MFPDGEVVTAIVKELSPLALIKAVVARMVACLIALGILPMATPAVCVKPSAEVKGIVVEPNVYVLATVIVSLLAPS
jgi:hypothetical protein